MITAALRSSADVNSIIHLRTVHLGPDDLLVAARSTSTTRCRSRSWPTPSTTPRSRCAPPSPKTTTIYIEPDIRRQPDPVSDAHGPVRHARPIGLAAMIAAVLTFSAGSTIDQEVRRAGADDRVLADARLRRRLDGAPADPRAPLRHPRRAASGARWPGWLLGLNIDAVLHGRHANERRQPRVHRRTRATRARCPPERSCSTRRSTAAPRCFGLISIAGLAIVLFDAPTRGEPRGSATAWPSLVARPPGAATCSPVGGCAARRASPR